MNKTKGFTIIELIVVIAIIAVLAGIVLVNVTSYINKGKDAAIKGNLSSLLTNSSVWFDKPAGVYTGFTTDAITGCGATGPVATAIAAAGGTLSCTETATLWCGSSKLKTDATKYFCVDSTGKKSESTTAICASGVCPD